MAEWSILEINILAGVWAGIGILTARFVIWKDDIRRGKENKH